MGDAAILQAHCAVPTAEALASAYYVWPVLHGSVGLLAEIFGIYIALAAGTDLLPAKWKLRRWKLWMRAELALWFFVLLSGIGTYLYWYTTIPIP